MGVGSSKASSRRPADVDPPAFREKDGDAGERVSGARGTAPKELGTRGNTSLQHQVGTVSTPSPSSREKAGQRFHHPQPWGRLLQPGNSL